MTCFLAHPLREMLTGEDDVTAADLQVKKSLVENVAQMAENIKVIDGRVQEALKRAKA